MARIVQSHLTPIIARSNGGQIVLVISASSAHFCFSGTPSRFERFDMCTRVHVTTIPHGAILLQFAPNIAPKSASEIAPKMLHELHQALQKISTKLPEKLPSVQSPNSIMEQFQFTYLKVSSKFKKNLM